MLSNVECSAKYLYILSSKIGELMLKRKMYLAIAESCTGGWISKVITDVSGSSKWFDRGLVTYSNAAKIDILGVRSITITKYGAVSAQVVSEMVTGILRYSASGTIAVAVSGIASGTDTDKQPPGTVYLAWAKQNCLPYVERKNFIGNREKVRQYSVAAALEGILNLYS